MLKELRETAWIALVALAANFAVVASCAGYGVLGSLIRKNDLEIPFLDGEFVTAFCFISIALAVGLGLRQTVMESRGGTWLFLLHRPAGMRRILAAKLAVGGGLYLLCGLIAILTYAAWAALPGRHASPFQWWMTSDAWRAWGVIAIVYPAAFLAGIRPARWFGTRLLPLAAGTPLALLLVPASFFSPLLGFAAFVLLAACLVGIIDFTLRTRDFS
jgi:hypothetical protein